MQSCCTACKSSPKTAINNLNCIRYPLSQCHVKMRRQWISLFPSAEAVCEFVSLKTLDIECLIIGGEMGFSEGKLKR